MVSTEYNIGAWGHFREKMHNSIFEENKCIRKIIFLFLGMRCLGIPNTAHFANVTQIEDAMALWEKLKTQKSEEAFKPDQEEEFEDSVGNVVNKKIYEDLKRQGLL